MAIAFKSYCVYRMCIRCLHYDLNCETMYPDCIQDSHLWSNFNEVSLPVVKA